MKEEAKTKKWQLSLSELSAVQQFVVDFPTTTDNKKRAVSSPAQQQEESKERGEEPP